VFLKPISTTLMAGHYILLGFFLSLESGHHQSHPTDLCATCLEVSQIWKWTSKILEITSAPKRAGPRNCLFWVVLWRHIYISTNIFEMKRAPNKRKTDSKLRSVSRNLIIFGRNGLRSSRSFWPTLQGLNLQLQREYLRKETHYRKKTGKFLKLRTVSYTPANEIWPTDGWDYVLNFATSLPSERFRIFSVPTNVQNGVEALHQHWIR